MGYGVVHAYAWSDYWGIDMVQLKILDVVSSEKRIKSQIANAKHTCAFAHVAGGVLLTVHCPLQPILQVKIFF